MAELSVIGKTFGRLTVIRDAGIGSSQKRLVLCQCACGAEGIFRMSDVRSGNTASCGCLVRTHGRTHTPEYDVWHGLKARCLNPRSKDWPKYGGRGITVCDRWLRFENFFADMGERPSSKHSIDRRDNDLGYSPENCHWVVQVTQERNKSTNARITYQGETLTVIEWSERLGIAAHNIYRRLYAGWSPDMILTTPIRPRKRS